MDKYRNAYVTLAQIRSGKDIVSTADDAELVRLIYAASRMVNRYTKHAFEPFRGTRLQDVNDAQLLELDTDLLSITTITSSGTALVSGTYALLPNNEYPKTQIARVGGSVWTWVTSPIQAVSITGIWGYNRNPDEMFTAVTTLAGALNATATSIPVVSAASIGYPSLIRVDDEYMRVTGVATNTLTVERGAMGTTAATHDDASTVQLYSVPDDIVYATQTLAIYLYETRDNFGERVASMDGAYVINKLAPSTVRDTLNSYLKNRFYTPP